MTRTHREKRDGALPRLTASAGLLSAFITMCLSYPQDITPYRGTLVSCSSPVPCLAIVASYFTLRGYLRDVWKAIAIAAASSWAYYNAVMTAAGFSREGQ